MSAFKNLRVFKYPLQIVSDQRIELPKGATILHAGDQGGTLCLWTMVDETAPVVQRHIAIYGTGHVIPIDVEPTHYVGTVMYGANGGLVWHVFDLGEVA